MVDNEHAAPPAPAPPVLVREALRGRRILVTGATGFLGTAIVAKILASVPEVGEILLAVRSKPGAPAAERVTRRVLGSNAFDTLREQPGWDSLAAKVTALDGDVTADRMGFSDDDLAKVRGVDLVIHSAATVSFDAPVDEAFETNLAGPLRLLDALQVAGAEPARFVHVSTAYVSGLVRGRMLEREWTHVPGRPRLDWRAELDVARRRRNEVEDESRLPERLAGFTKEARREVGPAGAPAVANRAEQLRRQWVTDRLVQVGRARATTLGWPDVYAFTKALAETAVVESTRPGLVSIVRPSIIESSIREPFPGWIRGFRMADPLFIAYGRGVLAEFPGLPDTVVDAVPVDLVVNAILAVAAADDPPAIVHASTGNRNPMRYRELLDYTHEYFHEHPYKDEDGQPIFPKLWTFPGRDQVHARIKWATRGLKVAGRVVDRLPRSRAGDVAERIDTLLADIDQSAKYIELYGAYAEVQSVFDDAEARALHERIPADQRGEFGFDPAIFDWRTYLQEIHLPEITRRRSAVRRRPRPAPRSRVRTRTGADVVLAVFDLEGTVLGTNVVESYLWIRLAASPRGEWPRRLADLAAKVPQMLISDRRDRGQFLRDFYRRYKGAPVDEVWRHAAEGFNNLILPRCFPEGIRRIRDHRAAGHRVVFLTGALDFTIAPLAPLADEISAARLEIDGRGRYTGDLIEVPLAGDARAVYLRRLAEQHGADLRACFAYGDSISDLPMLEAVGHPVAVNPDSRLARVARNRRWPVERWQIEEGSTRFSVPDRAHA